MSNSAIKVERHEDLHSSDVTQWRARWPNFSPAEMSCTHCGQLLVDPFALDNLQKVRTIYAAPIYIASAYRCEEHNDIIGGSPNSAHLRGRGYDPKRPRSGKQLYALLDAIWQVKPLGFGMGANKLHIDWDFELGHRVWMYGG